MALKDLQIPKVDVVVGAGSFAVRGLSTADIEFMVRRHGDELRSLFNEYVNGGKIDLSTMQVVPILKQLMSKAPALMHDIVVLAADADADDAKVLKQLPAGTHISALGAILGLTLSVEGEMGKALETAISLLGTLNGGLGEMAKELAKS